MNQRKIKSYVLRSGRVSGSYKKLLEEGRPDLLIPVADKYLNLGELFPGDGPVYVEIGFGTGEFLLNTAIGRPEDNFIGIEVYRQGEGKLLCALVADKIENVKILNGDATEVFARMIPPESLSGIHIMFPDPWPKKKHRKRRLLSLEFGRVLFYALKIGGYLWIATDWADYGGQIREVFAALPFTEITRENLASGHVDRYPSKYERKALSEGRQVEEFFYLRP